MDDGDHTDRRRHDPADADGDVSVFVIEDHAYLRSMLVDLIDAADGLMMVGASETESDGLAEVARLRPRVAVVDEGVGRHGGLRMCQELATTAPEVLCVLLTSSTAGEFGPHQAATGGVAECVTKQIRDFGLVDAINRVVAHAEPSDHSDGLKR